MKSGNKIMITFMFSVAVLLSIYARAGRGDLPQNSILANAETEHDTEILADEDFDEFDLLELDGDEDDIIISRPDSRDLDPRQKIMLQRELQRHENEMKKINLMRRRAREMLRNSEEMRERELARHYKSVREIQGE